MTTSRGARSGWTIPVTVCFVAAGATGAVTWAAVVPPAIMSASASPAPAPQTVTVVSRAQQRALDQAARELAQARRQLRVLRREHLSQSTGTVTAPTYSQGGSGATVQAPAPVRAAPAPPPPPPPVQTVTGASGATH